MKFFFFFCVFFLIFFLSSCLGSHTERFYGTNDSIVYFRNGNVDFNWRNH